MKPLLIGIDVGTSKLKAGLFDSEGSLCRELAADVATYASARGCMEIDLDRLMATLVNTLRALAADDGGRVSGIGFSVTSPTVVLMDRSGGAVRPGITYLDNRSVDEVRRCAQVLGEEPAYFAVTGNSPSPSTCSAGMLQWLRKNEPHNWQRTRKAGFLNTFLAAQFTGNFAADRTVASYSGLLRLDNPAAWNEELLALTGINSDLLPELVSSCTRVGGLTDSMASVTGLPAGAAVAIGSADTAAAAFALGVKRRGEVFHSIGTSEVLTFCLDRPEFNRAFMNRCHIIPGLWLAHGAMSATGAAISWLRNVVFPEYKTERELEAAAEKAPPGANGVIFLPYLSGERSPIFDPQASGGFFGITLNTAREDLVRAVYEGAALGIKQIFKIASDTWQICPVSVTCIGGAAKSALVVQTRADVLGIQYQAIETESAAAYGAALMGGLAAGLFGDFDGLPYLAGRSRTYRPREENGPVYAKLSAIYEQLYPNLKNVMHELYPLIKPP